MTTWQYLHRLFWLFAGLALFSVGYGLLMSLISVRLAREGYGGLTVGLIQTGF